MDKSLTSPQIATIKKRPHTLKRYLAKIPRNIVFSCIVDGDPITDPDTGAVIAFNYRDDEGTLGNVKLGYTIDIGTVEGASNVCQLRVRKTPDGTTFYVNETAGMEAPLADGQFVSIVAEHLIWQRRIRREIISDDPLDYAEWFDYDIAYGGENEDYLVPVTNITEDDSNDIHPADFVYFCDPGEEYATVTLSMKHSFHFDNKAITKQWTVFDGSYVVGDANSESITVQFPIGYREVRGVSSTDNAFSDRWYPILVLSGPDDPLLITEFDIDDDTRAEGRVMSFTVRDERVYGLHKSTPMVYFEVADFGGDDPPPQYIRQFIGWMLKDAQPLKLYTSTYKIDLGGPQAWLDKLGGYPWTIYDQRYPDFPTAEATKYIEFPNNTPDKTVHYVLRMYSTALAVMNFYRSDYDPPIEGFTANSESIWKQIGSIVIRYLGTAACDSSGALWLVRHYSYLEASERLLVKKIITLDKTYWDDKNPPTITEEYTDEYAQVDMYGSNFYISIDGGTLTDYSHVHRALAPSVIQGKGLATDTPQSVFLKANANAELQLTRLCGHHYARLQNRQKDIPIPLNGNYDILEPAWGIPIVVNFTDRTKSGKAVSNREYMVKSVSVSHSNDRKKLPKAVTWNAEKVTSGDPAVAIEDVLQSPDTGEYPPITYDDAPPPSPDGTFPIGGIAIAAHSAQAGWSYAFHEDTGDIDWYDISAGKVGVGGPNVGNPYNPYTMWNFSSAGFEVLTIPPGDPASSTWTNPFSLTDLYGAGATRTTWALASHMVHGWIMAQADNGKYVISTDSGLTFTRYTGSYSTAGLAPHNPNVIIAVDYVGLSPGLHWQHVRYFISTDGGVSFSALSINPPDAYGDPGSANPVSSLGLDIPYLRPSSLGGGNNYADSNMVIREVGSLRYGGGIGGHYSESSNKAASFSATISSLTGEYDAISGTALASTHTWDADASIWCLGSQGGLGQQDHVIISLDHGATIHSNTILWTSIPDDYLMMRHNGWPCIDTSDPDIGVWVSSAFSFYDAGRGGAKITFNNGVNWWGSRPSFFTYDGVSDWQLSLIGKIPNLEDV